MAKNCPHCQTELPDDAAFCYECGKPQPSPDADEPRRAPRWLSVLLFVLIVFTGFAVFQMSQPKDFLGTYELDYTAEDDTAYHLTLSFGSPEEACESIILSGGTPVTTYLYVTDAEGRNAISTFQPMVEDVDVIALPVGGAMAGELSESGHDEQAWSCVVYNDSTAGSNIIRWTLELENGDKLIISHKVDYTK